MLQTRQQQERAQGEQKEGTESAAGGLPEDLPELLQFSRAEDLTPWLDLEKDWVIFMTIDYNCR